MKEQAANKRRSGRFKHKYKIYEREMTLEEIQKEYGISAQLFIYRKNKGMKNEEIIEFYKNKKNTKRAF